MNDRHYAYIIYSIEFDKYYKGYSSNPLRRLEEHNSGRSHYTSQFCPWKLVYIEEFIEKSDALKREKGLKKYSKDQVLELIKLSKNVINQFL